MEILRSIRTKVQKKKDPQFTIEKDTEVSKPDKGKELANESSEFNSEIKENVTHVLFGFSGVYVEYLAKPQAFLLWYCILSFLQNMVVNGFVNSSLATIEKRYELSSLESSFVASSYDIGCLLVVLLVSYYGNTPNKVRWIGIGGIIMGIGSFIFFCPHLLSGKYEYGLKSSIDIPLCKNTTNTEKCSVTQTKLENFKYLFYIGQFFIGVGASPLFPLGLASIEERVNKKTSAMYIGISTAIAAVGPAAGYVVFGFFLKIYVDINIPSSEMTCENTDIWVGAWWLGFLIAGIAFIIFALPLIFFPIPKPLQNDISGGPVVKMADVKDILKLSKSILTNITYNCLTVSSALTMLCLTGLSTYGPKYFEMMFGFTSSLSTIISGIVVVPTFVFGALCGGIIISHYNMKQKGSLLFMFITTLISIPMGFSFFFKCNSAKMAGVNTKYINGRSTDEGLYSSCNLNCNCLSSQPYFRPTCGMDYVIYYSPCFAGCTHMININKSNYYQNCQCISKDQSIEYGVQSFDRICRDAICNYFYVFLFIFGAYLFLIASQGVPVLTSSIRCVERKEIPLSLGIRSIFARCFGSVPGPILFGYAIDRACIYWFQNCKHRGNCLKYDNYLYSRSLVILVIVLTAGNATCYFVAFYKVSWGT